MTIICFKNVSRKIYPPELALNLEGSGDHLSYLDLDFTKVNRHVDVKLFDKRDAFPFSIVRLPFVSSNIPSNMFYSAITAEILRIGRICSSQQNFLSSAKPVIARAVNQGANDSKLSKALKKIYGRQKILQQYGKNASFFSTNLMLSR